MTDVFTVLSKDHEEVKGMLAELEKGPTVATGASEEQLMLRKKMAEELIIEESRHEAVEEMFFWPAVRDHLPGRGRGGQGPGQGHRPRPGLILEQRGRIWRESSGIHQLGDAD